MGLQASTLRRMRHLIRRMPRLENGTGGAVRHLPRLRLAPEFPPFPRLCFHRRAIHARRIAGGIDTRVLEPLDNPFGPRLLPMEPIHSVTPMSPGWTVPREHHV